MTKQQQLDTVCRQFSFAGVFDSVIPYGDGHINDTYKVTYLDEEQETVNYILQRVNHDVFKDTEGLMNNIENITSYLSDIITEEELLDGYEVLTLIPTIAGRSFYQDELGNYWRAYIFVEEAVGHTFAEEPSLLYEAGKAFGQFQKMLRDYPVASLTETIKDFHNTKARYETFLEILKEDPEGRRSTCEEAISFIMDRQGLVGVLVEALESGAIPYRVTHNDTKINNVLIDEKTGFGRCVIDLDTVMPGSALYDYGDAIRSCGSTVAEDAENLDDLKLDYERYEAYTSGFLAVIGDYLNETEIQMLPEAAILMTFECGMRFLTDYLNGDKYFKTHKDRHNLIRAKNQFKFVEEMEKHFDDMQSIVKRSLGSRQ